MTLSLSSLSSLSPKPVGSKAKTYPPLFTFSLLFMKLFWLLCRLLPSPWAPPFYFPLGRLRRSLLVLTKAFREPASCIATEPLHSVCSLLYIDFIHCLFMWKCRQCTLFCMSTFMHIHSPTPYISTLNSPIHVIKMAPGNPDRSDLHSFRSFSVWQLHKYHIDAKLIVRPIFSAMIARGH